TAIVQIVHEALLAHWPRLAKLLAQSREFLRVRTRVEDAVSRWVKEKRSDDYLLSSGKPLIEGRDLLAHHQADLPADAVEFLSRSVHKDESARNYRARVKYWVTTAFVLLVGTFGVVSVSQKRDAKRAQARAEEQERIAVEQKDTAEN